MADLIPPPDWGLVYFLAVVCILPGPLNMILMTSGLAGRARFGAGFLAGGALAYAALFAVASAATREIAGWDPRILGAMQIAATLILLRLAWKIATAPVGAPAASRAGSGAGAGLLAGIALVSTGSKSIPTALAAAALYCDGRLGPAEHAILFATTALVMVPLACGCWLVAGLAMGRAITSPRLLRAVNLAGGGSIAVLAVALVV